jgi:ribose 1,5-bisphosphate isomerase
LKIPEEAKRIADNIRDMRIRGAALIARSAAEALQIVAQESRARDVEEFVTEMNEASGLLLRTRPTAVSLPNGIRFVMHRVDVSKGKAASVDDIRSIAIAASNEFIESAKIAVQRIGEIGARRIRDGDVVLTHCNSSAVIAIMKTAWNDGKRFEVLVTETRPRFQGHITARELARVGIPVTLVLDDAVRYFMQGIDKVIVGADAITANGALVNKIGTSMVALAAHEARVRVCVAAETYKFSPETLIGELVTIEERNPFEIISEEKRRQLGPIRVRNPSFDVTPPEFIDLIVTERGIIPPLGAFLILEEVFGIVTPEELRDYRTYSLQEE